MNCSFKQEDSCALSAYHLVDNSVKLLGVLTVVIIWNNLVTYIVRIIWFRVHHLAVDVMSFMVLHL